MARSSYRAKCFGNRHVRWRNGQEIARAIIRLSRSPSDRVVLSAYVGAGTTSFFLSEAAQQAPTTADRPVPDQPHPYQLAHGLPPAVASKRRLSLASASGRDTSITAASAVVGTWDNGALIYASTSSIPSPTTTKAPGSRGRKRMICTRIMSVPALSAAVGQWL